MKFFPCIRAINKVKWKAFLAVQGMGRTPTNVVSKRNQSTASKEMRRAALEGSDCISANGWPHCLQKHRLRGQGNSHEMVLAIFTHPAQPIASKICSAFGGFVWVVWYYNSVIVVQYSSLLTSAEVFQAWWWTPAHYREEIQAAVVPGIRSCGEMWEDERRPWGLFLWWLNTKAFNSFSSSWVIGILN